VEFEWDEPKAQRNLRAHGVDFREARTVFDDPLVMLKRDEGHSHDEERFILLGRSEQGQTLVTIFAERGSRFRIISSRRATPREVRSYEKGV